MAIEIGGNRFANLQEQVAINTNDISIIKKQCVYHGPFNTTDDIPDDELVEYGMYLIGSTYPFSIYKYENESFTYCGQYAAAGPAGQPGAPGQNGQRGPAGIPGNGIRSVDKTSSVGLVDTYTITFTDNTTTTFEVTNGKDGEGVSTVEVYFPTNTSEVEITEEQYNTLVNNKESILMITAADFEGGSYYYNEGISHYDPSNPAYELSHPVWGQGSLSQDQPIRYIWRNIARVIKDEPNNKYYVTNWGGMQLAAVTIEDFYHDYEDQLPHGTYHLEVTYNGIDPQTHQTLISAQWVLNNS